jgi:hypothetical protein
VVVVTLTDVDTAYPEEAPKLLERGSTSDALRHHKPMRHLIAGFVASALASTGLPDKPNGEASLSVYKTYNPAELNQSFLLVFCTRHIFTVPSTRDATRSAGYSGFPAYSQMLTTRLPAWRAAIYLRHDCYVTYWLCHG